MVTISYNTFCAPCKAMALLFALAALLLITVCMPLGTGASRLFTDNAFWQGECEKNVNYMIGFTNDAGLYHDGHCKLSCGLCLLQAPSGQLLCLCLRGICTCLQGMSTPLQNSLHTAAWHLPSSARGRTSVPRRGVVVYVMCAHAAHC